MGRIATVAIGALIVIAAGACATAQPEQSLRARFVEPTPLPTTRPIPAVTSVPTPTAVPMPTPVPTSTALPVREVTLSFSGDVLSHTPVIAAAATLSGGAADGGLSYDYLPMFAQVQQRLSDADLAICVLETPLSPTNTDLTGYPSFNAPGDLADALARAGFDACSTASNHSLDRGVVGIANTLDELDRVGLAHAGMARTEQEHLTPVLHDVDGVTVAQLSWTYGLNGYVRPTDQLWSVNVTEPELILAEARRAREAGADIVVLMIQWGAEYQVDPTPEQRDLAAILTSSPAIDVIVGNHAHVVQPIDEINDKVVVFGLGNFLSNQPAPGYPARTQDGMIVELTFAGTSADGFEITTVGVVPTWVNKGDLYTVLPVVDTLAASDLSPDLRSSLEASLERTIEATARLGVRPLIE